MMLLKESNIFRNDIQKKKLYKFLPPKYRIQNLRQIFSTSLDGCSLQTFIRNSEDISRTLLVVKDALGFIFGAFVSEPWRINSEYFGTGETFLFSLSPKLRVYKWAKSNEFFQFCTVTSLHLGSGTRQRWNRGDSIDKSRASISTVTSTATTSNVTPTKMT